METGAPPGYLPAVGFTYDPTTDRGRVRLFLGDHRAGTLYVPDVVREVSGGSTACYLRMEETSGVTAFDSIGTRDAFINNAVGLGKAGLIAGTPGTCFEFDLLVPQPNLALTDEALWTAAPFSMFGVARMKGPPTLSEFDVSPIMLKEGPGWSFSVGFDSKPFFTIFDASPGGKTSVTAEKAKGLNQTWAQGATFTGGHIELFVDGLTQGARAITAPHSTAAGVLRLGATGSEQFVGFLDECVFFGGKVLTREQMKALADAALKGWTVPPLFEDADIDALLALSSAGTGKLAVLEAAYTGALAVATDRAKGAAQVTLGSLTMSRADMARTYGDLAQKWKAALEVERATGETALQDWTDEDTRWAKIVTGAIGEEKEMDRF